MESRLTDRQLDSLLGITDRALDRLCEAPVLALVTALTIVTAAALTASVAGQPGLFVPAAAGALGAIVLLVAPLSALSAFAWRLRMAQLRRRGPDENAGERHVPSGPRPLPPTHVMASRALDSGTYLALAFSTLYGSLSERLARTKAGSRREADYLAIARASGLRNALAGGFYPDESTALEMVAETLRLYDALRRNMQLGGGSTREHREALRYAREALAKVFGWRDDLAAWRVGPRGAIAARLERDYVALLAGLPPAAPRSPLSALALCRLAEMRRAGLRVARSGRFAPALDAPSLVLEHTGLIA